MTMRNSVTVVASNALPYGSEITESLKDILPPSYTVTHVTINIYNPLYVISRLLPPFSFLKSLYAYFLISRIIRQRPNYIVLYLGPSPFSKNDILRLRHSIANLRLFTWFIDVLCFDKEFSCIAFLSDYVGSLSQSDLSLLERTRPSGSTLSKTVLLPCYFNERIFSSSTRPKDITVFFAGSWSHKRLTNRRLCLKWLASIASQYNLKCVIFGRSNLSNPLLLIIDLYCGRQFLKYIKKGPIFGSELAAYYQRAHFTIECPADNQVDANPMRSYEALACGAKVLYFDSNSQVVSTSFNSREQLERILAYSLLYETSLESTQYSASHPDSLHSRVLTICDLLNISLGSSSDIN